VLLFVFLWPLCARAAPPALIVEAELVPARVYVGGEALLRLRALRAPGMPHGVLRPPALGDAAEISLAGTIDTYQSERAGVLYDVLERTHVIVPRRAGRSGSTSRWSTRSPTSCATRTAPCSVSRRASGPAP
jgi:hypothetical protein